MSRDLIIIYDGICGLCSASVRFVLEHDRAGRFAFVPAQSPLGQRLEREHGIDALATGTLVLLDHGQVRTRSDAVAAIGRRLDGVWRILGWLRFLPPRLRDWAYTQIAKRRLAWFGEAPADEAPPPQYRDRFLDEI